MPARAEAKILAGIGFARRFGLRTLAGRLAASFTAMQDDCGRACTHRQIGGKSAGCRRCGRRCFTPASHQ
jgi:hypothetical protein